MKFGPSFLVAFALLAAVSGLSAQERVLVKATAAELSRYGLVGRTLGQGWSVVESADTSLIEQMKAAGIYAEPDRRASISVDDNDSLFGLQWGLTGSNGTWHGDFSGAWKITEGDSSIIVGIIDTGSPLKDGVWTHPDLDSSRFRSVDLATTTLDSDASVTDYSGHATHVAGIIGATMGNRIGVAGIDQHCRIIIYKAFSMYGYGSYSDIIDAIYRGVHDGCNVLSASFGGIYYSKALEDAVHYAYEHGVVCVVAAGNDGTEMSEYPAFFGRFSTYADLRSGFRNVISVGAIDNNGSVAAYSNRGWFVDVYAPGGSGVYPFADPSNVLSTMPEYNSVLGQPDSLAQFQGDSIVWRYIPAQIGYGYLAGTSMATPFVTGTVSLMLGANRKLTPGEVRDIIDTTADSMMTVNGPIAILDPSAAVLAAKNFGGTMTVVRKETQGPAKFALDQNYPNPFNPTTTISFSLAESGHTTLKVYNTLGEEVASLADGQLNAGPHRVSFDGSRLASGVYFYRLQGPASSIVKKMLLLK